MSSEAQVRANLLISIPANNFQYQNKPTDFTEDVSVANGPTPGVVTVPITGININLSQLKHPGLCSIQNLDDPTLHPLNYVMIGPYDGVSFYPMIEIRPGKGYVFRLYRYLNAEFVGTGTNADVNYLRAMAFNASCNIRVEAFDD